MVAKMSRDTVSVFDVAKYIVRQFGEISAMKLQKLVYYSQAWSLVWEDSPLFREKIEAWVSGPVVRALYQLHRGKFLLKPNDISSGDIRKLHTTQKSTIDNVLRFYGDKDSQWLSDLTHIEKPWIKARRGLGELEKGSKEIILADMAEYYSTITQNA